MKPKRVDPITGVMNFMKSMASGMQPQKIARDELADGVVIDTCTPADTMIPETGILRPSINDGRYIIAEQYSDVEMAKVGHSKWVKMITEYPDLPE